MKTILSINKEKAKLMWLVPELVKFPQVAFHSVLYDGKRYQKTEEPIDYFNMGFFKCWEYGTETLWKALPV